MNKIPVAVLGATGIVGQRFVQMLADHPWFEIAAVVGSKRSAGRKYGDAANWVIAGDPPENVIDMTVLGLEDDIPGRIAFSALPTGVAREVEPGFAEKGFAVCSNASAFRQAPGVPVIIPEVNGDHIAMLEHQRIVQSWKGLIITSPNCTTTGMVMAIKPLHEAYEVDKVFVTSFQAISGAGYPGVSFLDINDNLIPYIKGEEEKMESESLLLLGKMDGTTRIPADIVVSAQANRAPVLHGHTVCLSMSFRNKPSVEEAIATLQNYRGPEVAWNLPSAPERPVVITMQPDRPQPRRDRDAQNGMVCTVGRVRPCPLLDLRLVSVTHNAIRGAAGGSVLNAELLVSGGYIS